MSPKASGTLRLVLSFYLALSSIVVPALTAPTQAEHSSPWFPSLKSLFEPRQANQCDGTGLVIKNKASYPQTITVFEGKWTIVSNPYKHPVTIPAGKSTTFALTDGFIGHVQRGAALPATWVELNMVAATGTGDDLTVWGFTKNINERCIGPNCAPGDAYYVPGSGAALAGPGTSATDVLDAPTNSYAAAFEQQRLSQAYEYLVGGSGTNQAISSNGCLVVTFY